LSRYGPRRFYVLNTGISTIQALQLAAEALATEGILLHYTDFRTVLGPIESRVAHQEGGTHADEIETSIMLTIAPAVVDMGKAVKDYHSGRGGLTRNPQGQGVYSPSGVFGDPTLATREKGDHLVEALISGILQDIETLRCSELPQRL
jgi:creatinine amidohydrolase